MMKKLFYIVAIVIAVSLLPIPAMAEDVENEETYTDCEKCHGKRIEAKTIDLLADPTLWNEVPTTGELENDPTYWVEDDLISTWMSATTMVATARHHCPP